MSRQNARGQKRPGRGSRLKRHRLLPIAQSPEAASAALVLFAKAPIPGQVKTRLCPPLTADEAATLHGTFVLDAVERSREAATQQRLPLDRFVACAPSPAHTFFKVLEARHGVRLLPQTGEDLGARMRHAFQHVFTLGYRSAILTGTDVPQVPVSIYGEAIEQLMTHDLILGPAMDGGYYLIGLNRMIPDLFSSIPWSTDSVLSLTLKKAEAAGLQTALLPMGRDVDRLEDLLALIEDMKRGRGTSSPLTSHPSPLTPILSKRTAGVLQMLAGRLRTRAAHHDSLTGKAAGTGP